MSDPVFKSKRPVFIVFTALPKLQFQIEIGKNYSCYSITGFDYDLHS